MAVLPPQKKGGAVQYYRPKSDIQLTNTFTWGIAKYLVPPKSRFKNQKPQASRSTNRGMDMLSQLALCKPSAAAAHHSMAWILDVCLSLGQVFIEYMRSHKRNQMIFGWFLFRRGTSCSDILSCFGFHLLLASLQGVSLRASGGASLFLSHQSQHWPPKEIAATTSPINLKQTPSNQISTILIWVFP